MYSKILNSIFLIVAFAMVSCNMPDNPINSAYSPNLVQVEEKWESDLVSLTKQRKVYYKEFDRDGNVVLYVKFGENSDTSSKSIFTYEDNTSTEHFISFTEDGTVLEDSQIKCIYDNSKLVEKKKYDNNGELEKSWTFDYNNHGHLERTTQKDMSQGSSYIKTNNNEYNNVGELTGISYQIDASGDVNPNHADIEKDSIVYLSNNSIEFYKIDKNGEINKVYSYIYDQTGKISAELVSDSKGAIQNRYDYYYSYFK